jgi:hypothetical protein
MAATRSGSESDMDWGHGSSYGQRLQLSLDPSKTRKAMVPKVTLRATVSECQGRGGKGYRRTGIAYGSICNE